MGEEGQCLCLQLGLMLSFMLATGRVCMGGSQPGLCRVWLPWSEAQGALQDGLNLWVPWLERLSAM